jgi:drug/metabolite transporter (DMT)-like permease
MQLLFSKSIDLFGKDKTAYFSWGTASILWVLGFMYVSEQGIDSYSSNLSRGTMLLLFNLPEMLRNKVWLSRETIRVMTVRHVLLVLYGFVFAQSFFYLPINIVHTLYSAGPIFVMAIDYALNRITITNTQRWGAFVAFFGVLLTVNGHFLYSALGRNEGANSEFKHYRP